MSRTKPLMFHVKAEPRPMIGNHRLRVSRRATPAVPVPAAALGRAGHPPLGRATIAAGSRLSKTRPRLPPWGVASHTRGPRGFRGARKPRFPNPKGAGPAHTSATGFRAARAVRVGPRPAGAAA
jgi:hypothetical protein